MKKMLPVLSALFSGLLLSAAWPANGFAPLVLIAFVPLLLQLNSILNGTSDYKYLKITGLSYLTFFIWNLLTTWWVWNSTPEGGVTAVVCNALFMAVVVVLSAYSGKALGSRIGKYALILYWIAFEYVHADWDLSWPWLTLGNVFASLPQWIQWYEYTGTTGGTLWILTINLLVVDIVREKTYKKVTSILPVVAVFLLPVGFSYYRYFTWKDTGDSLTVRIIQPNIDPWNDKYGGMTSEQQLARMYQLMIADKSCSPDVYILPETAYPFGVMYEELDSTSRFDMFRSVLKSGKPASVLLGITDFRKFDKNAGDTIPLSAEPIEGMEGSYYDDYNSAILLDSGRSWQLYHKSKLVPGPEMLPFASLLKPFQNSIFKQLGPVGNLGTQNERTVFRLKGGATTAPIICYESVYGDFVTEYVRKGASFLSIITNDGWWGNTPGHKQHFQYARLRAVENRRWVARSANTGISGVINARGDVVTQTPYWTEAAFCSEIRLNTELTPYTKSGDLIGRMSLFTALTLLLYVFVRGYLKKRAY
jgi:apolipoprotein N-acyltransferase